MIREDRLVLEHRIEIRRHLRQLTPIPRPLLRQEHLTTNRDPERLQVIRKNTLTRERIRILPRMIGHPPEVRRTLPHPIEHRSIRTHRPEPRVIRQQHLIELRQPRPHMIQSILMRPDIEPDVLPNQDLVRHRLQLAATLLRQRNRSRPPAHEPHAHANPPTRTEHNRPQPPRRSNTTYTTSRRPPTGKTPAPDSRLSCSCGPPDPVMIIDRPGPVERVAGRRPS